MGRPRSARSSRPVPAPLPPETRTVGQLVAESIRLYGSRFWLSLSLGLSVAIIDQALTGRSHAVWLVLMPTAGSVLVTLSFIGATIVASGVRAERRTLATAFAAGVVVFVPFPLLLLAFVLPGFAWLAFVGLAVPAILLEGRGFRDGLRRGVELARADYVHVLGSLATLAITFFLTRLVLFFLLRGQGDATDRVAAFLADLVLSPIVFLGSALVYFDQAARVVGSPPNQPRRSRNADVRDAVDADRAGRTDPEVESRPAARGQP